MVADIGVAQVVGAEVVPVAEAEVVDIESVGVHLDCHFDYRSLFVPPVIGVLTKPWV